MALAITDFRVRWQARDTATDGQVAKLTEKTLELVFQINTGSPEFQQWIDIPAVWTAEAASLQVDIPTANKTIVL